MEDIRIMRRTISREVRIDGSAADLIVLDESPSRVAILFGTPGSFAYYVSTRQMTANGQGISIQPTQNPVIIKLEDVGDIIRRSWHLWSSGAQIITVVETILPEN